jgi:hypothetical protein
MLEDTYKNAGIHQAFWDGRDDGGISVGSGVYIYQLNTYDFNSNGKILLLR